MAEYQTEDERYLEEERAVQDIIRNKKITTLLGIGALYHTGHCFRLGFPDTMLLFDPVWKDEAEIEYEIENFKQSVDKDKPPKIIQRTNDLDIVEFYFAGQKKTIYYYKTLYYPGILGRTSPNLLHIGHRSIKLSDEQISETLILLPTGTIILNLVAGISIFHFTTYLIANYFLDSLGSYVFSYGDFGPETTSIFSKNRRINEKELALVLQFAELFHNLWKGVKDKGYFEECENIRIKIKDMSQQEKIKYIFKHKPGCQWILEPKWQQEYEQFKKTIGETPDILRDLIKRINKEKILEIIMEMPAEYTDPATNKTYSHKETLKKTLSMLGLI